MRYLAGFMGGFVVAILLFAFQDYLISGERAGAPSPPVVITLGEVTKPKPHEYKIYEPRRPPEEPRPIEKPAGPVDPTTTTRVEPPRIPLTNIESGIPGGNGPSIWRDIGSGVLDGSAGVKTMLEPQFPPQALRDGVEGEVEVEFTILPDGTVADVVVIRAEPRGVFERNARHAILQWQFFPKRVNGVAVETRARQVLVFRLPE